VLAVETQVALVVSVPATISALGAWRASRKTARRIGNGPKPTNELLNEVLVGQAGQDKRLAKLERQVNRLDADLCERRIQEGRATGD
jgi:hypothetical protein